MPSNNDSGQRSTQRNGSDAAPKSPSPTVRDIPGTRPKPNTLHNVQASSIPERDEPTPTKAVFDLVKDDDDEDADMIEDLDDDEVEEDEEFQSHYSRQSSPASSTSDLDHPNTLDEADEDGDSSDPSLAQVQRINSMPTTAIHAHTHTHTYHSNIHTSRSTTALNRNPPPLPPPLYPPFYNKPPTPLPPSPSLTSLLRPPSLLNRSTTSTRPTSPDSSDVETPNDTEAQVVHQARRANPLPPTAPRVPTYEYYGFVLYLASSLAFLIYLLWSYLPSPFLHALGITYYPDRWWALALPAWIVIVIVYIYVALACWNVEYLTLGMGRVETSVDDAGNVAVLDEGGRIRKGGSKRFEVEREIWAGRKVGGKGSYGRKRGKREKERERREREIEDSGFGYVGDVVGGGVASGLSWRQIWNEGTDAVMDVPLGGVCEVLYGEGRDLLE